MQKKIKMGIIGGGKDAFIGAIHRIAAQLDNKIELVCGAFSSNPEKSIEFGKTLFLEDSRIYPDYATMIKQEAALPAEKRMDFVSIVTPNHLHFAPAKMALEYGFNVVLDKPVTFSLEEAKALEKIIEKSGKLFCLTHTYTGYPMVKEAKQLIQQNKIGKIRKIVVSYTQGWLTTFLENSQQKQAAWRTDPTKSGIAGSMGDIGTHAFNLVEYISGLEVVELCASLQITVPNRLLDDDGMVFLKFDNAATGLLYATQIAAGEENNLKINIYGELGGIEWQHKDQNSLLLKLLDKPTEILRAGTPYLSAITQYNLRTPSGHPEGYIEAFANLYKNFAETCVAVQNNQKPSDFALDFPGIKEGIRGMAFIETVVQSAKSSEKWTKFIQ